MEAKTYLSAALSAFGISFVFCLLLIPVLRKLKAGQNGIPMYDGKVKKNNKPK